MSKNRNHYEILGVGEKATTHEIKKAYRTLCFKHHPDKGGNEEIFKLLNEAHQILSDPEKRRQYDYQLLREKEKVREETYNQQNHKPKTENKPTYSEPKKTYSEAELIEKYIIEKNIIELKKILRSSNVNIKLRLGNRPIILAAELGNYEIVELLVNMRADINEEYFGYAALYYAIKNNHNKIAKFLIDKNANLKFSNGIDAEFYAKYYKNEEIVNYIKDRNNEIIYNYIENKNINGLREIIDYRNINNFLKDGSTPIILAAKLGRYDIVKLLIDKGANLNNKDKNGLTALQHAIFQNKNDIAEFLIKKGASLKFSNESNAESYAEKYNSHMYEYITKNNTNLIYFYIENNNIEKLRRILKHSDVNIKLLYGFYTPISFAAKIGNYEIVKLLIDMKADLNSTGSYGHTALQSAIMKKHNDIAKLLIDKGASLKFNNLMDAEFTAKIYNNNEIENYIKSKKKPEYKPDPVTPSYIPSYTPKYTPSYTPSYTPKYTPSYTPSDTSKYTPSYTPSDTSKYTPGYTPSKKPILPSTDIESKSDQSNWFNIIENITGAGALAYYCSKIGTELTKFIKSGYNPSNCLSRIVPILKTPILTIAAIRAVATYISNKEEAGEKALLKFGSSLVEGGIATIAGAACTSLAIGGGAAAVALPIVGSFTAAYVANYAIDRLTNNISK